jgi:hypothetical protein
MLWQCAHCGKQVDDQEDDHEAFEVSSRFGTHWHYYHVLCLDTLRSIERKLKVMGNPTKTVLPQNVVAIKGSWSATAVCPT